MTVRMNDLAAISRSAAYGLYLGDQTVLAVVLGELRMVLDSRDRGIVPHLILDGFWEMWVTAWMLNNLRPGESALNIGANCGYYALAMARRVGPTGALAAIEPDARHCRNIRHSLHLNGLHTANVRVVQAVASDRAGTLSFNARSDGMTMNSAVAKGGDGNCQVDAVTADSVMPDATFALIDTEGHEPEVWDGMVKIRQNHGFRAVIEWSPGRYADPRGFYQKIIGEGFVTSFVDFDSIEKPAPESLMMDGVERMVVLRRPS